MGLSLDPDWTWTGPRVQVQVQGPKGGQTGPGLDCGQSSSAPKHSQAEMHGMHEVFPEAVTYAAVQVSFELSVYTKIDQMDLPGLLQPLLPQRLGYQG